MASFDLIELSLDPLDVTPTLEDEFTSTVVKNEIENLDDGTLFSAFKNRTQL